MNNPWMWSVVENICLFILIGISVFFTKSAWPLLGLYFVRRLSSNKVSDKEEEE